MKSNNGIIGLITISILFLFSRIWVQPFINLVHKDGTIYYNQLTWHNCGPMTLMVSKTDLNSCSSASSLRMSSSRGSTACRQDSAFDIQSVNLEKSNYKILHNIELWFVTRLFFDWFVKQSDTFVRPYRDLSLALRVTAIFLSLNRSY